MTAAFVVLCAIVLALALCLIHAMGLIDGLRRQKAEAWRALAKLEAEAIALRVERRDLLARCGEAPE